MPFSLFHRSPVSDGTANRVVATPKNCRRRPLFTLFRTTIWKSWSRPTRARVTCPLWSPAKRVSTIQHSCPKCSPTLPNDWSAAAKWSELCVTSVKVRAVVTRRNCCAICVFTYRWCSGSRPRPPSHMNCRHCLSGTKTCTCCGRLGRRWHSWDGCRGICRRTHISSVRCRRRPTTCSLF